MRYATQVMIFGLLATAMNAFAASSTDTCSAKGTMEGEPFVADHCVLARGQNNDVAIWFNESEISSADQDSYRASSYVDDERGTWLTVEFCPGGGKPVASPDSVTSIHLMTNHAKSSQAGVQWTLQAPKDFSVEKMEGTLSPGSQLVAKIVSKRSKTNLDLEFNLTLPANGSGKSLMCSNDSKN